MRQIVSDMCILLWWEAYHFGVNLLGKFSISQTMGQVNVLTDDEQNEKMRDVLPHE